MRATFNWAILNNINKLRIDTFPAKEHNLIEL
nr:MAG TPA: hypothetical protein [Caudoviricetes sp.]